MKLWCIVYARTIKWRVPGVNSEADTIRKEVKTEVFRVVAADSTMACAVLSSRHSADPAFVIKTFDAVEIDAIVTVH